MSRINDLTGKKFGRLTVIDRSYREFGKRTFWNVICDCNEKREIESSKLISGHTKSCGCYRTDNQRTDITGRRFGRLIVLGFSHIEKGNGSKWKVRCDCGVEKTVRTNALIGGLTTSCGCFQREIAKKTTNKYRSHGMSTTHLHRKWTLMKERCDNPNTDSYYLYGGRGISYCRRWEKFENFLEDMSNSYDKHKFKYGEKETTLDRLDNNKDYSPENCRWATNKMQSRNKRNTRWLTAFGETFCMTEWAEKLKISVSKINCRLRRGWSVERTLSTL